MQLLKEFNLAYTFRVLEYKMVELSETWELTLWDTTIRQRERLEMQQVLWNLKAYPQWDSSSKKAMLHNFSQSYISWGPSIQKYEIVQVILVKKKNTK